MGYMAEATVFAFVGVISAREMTEKQYCWQFAAAEFFVVILGRGLAIFISYGLFTCCKGNPENKLNCSQLTFITYAALIRGAIAFGLSQELNPETFGSNPGIHA